jgi:hypothetical protein
MWYAQPSRTISFLGLEDLGRLGAAELRGLRVGSVVGGVDEKGVCEMRWIAHYIVYSVACLPFGSREMRWHARWRGFGGHGLVRILCM